MCLGVCLDCGNHERGETCLFPACCAASHQDPDAVLCPCCQQAYLVQAHGVIACPKEQFQVQVRAEGLGLPDLKKRLLDVYQASLWHGCVSGWVGVAAACFEHILQRPNCVPNILARF